MSTGTNVAEAPFETYTLAHVSRMGGQTASTLRELAEGLETCSDESIYHHTIVAIRNQLALTDSVTNDFEQWARTSLKREELAEPSGDGRQEGLPDHGRFARSSLRDCAGVYGGEPGNGG